MIEFGRKAIASLVGQAERAAAGAWLGMLDACIAAAGGMDGADTGADTQHGVTPPRRHSARPYVYDRVPHRDERFQDLWNQGVNAESFIYNERLPARAKTLM